MPEQRTIWDPVFLCRITLTPMYIYGDSLTIGACLKVLTVSRRLIKGRRIYTLQVLDSLPTGLRVSLLRRLAADYMDAHPKLKELNSWIDAGKGRI